VIEIPFVSRAAKLSLKAFSNNKVALSPKVVVTLVPTKSELSLTPSNKSTNSPTLISPPLAIFFQTEESLLNPLFSNNYS